MLQVRADVIIRVYLNGVALPDVLKLNIVCRSMHADGEVVPSLPIPDGRCGCPAGYEVEGQVRDAPIWLPTFCMFGVPHT